MSTVRAQSAAVCILAAIHSADWSFTWRKVGMHGEFTPFLILVQVVANKSVWIQSQLGHCSH